MKGTHVHDVGMGADGAGRGPSRRLTLVGGFALTVDGAEVPVPVSGQRIVALLALGGRCGRGRLARTLWPETTELRALANLRTAIWRANQHVPGLVVPVLDSLVLGTDVDVDVARLVRTGHDVLEGRAAPAPLDAAGSELLPDWHDEWLVPDRERVRQLRLHVLESLAGQLAEQGSYGMAMEVALAALRADPLRESAHRVVIRIHLAEGNLGEASHAYRQCVELLERELGLEPSRETARLVDRLGDPLSVVV